ncbi:MAG: lysylphosphatidylglycerol synthase transmembrane domain-containing protein [Pirellulaceae bacterium]
MFSRRTFKILLALVVVTCFLYVGRNYFGQLHLITHAHWLGVVGIVIVHLLTLWLQGLTYKWGLDSFDRSISDKESFVLFVISSYANLVLPRSGVGTTALYLNRSRKVPIIDYSSVVIYGAVLFVFACSAIGCFLFGLDWLAQERAPAWWILLGLPAMLLASGLAILIHWRIPASYNGPGHLLFERLNHANSRLVTSGNVYRIGLAHFVLVFLRAFRLYIAFWALGIEVSFYAVLLTSVLGDLAFVIAVTPGALGFREAAIAIAAARLGIDAPIAISVAIFDRLVFSLAVAITAQLLIAFVMRNDGSRLVESTPAN